MDLDEFRTILGNSRVNIWEFIETAIRVATLDYGDEFRVHRDGIVAKLYANCPNCDAETRVRTSGVNGLVPNTVVEAVFGVEDEGHNKGHSPYTPVSIGGDDFEVEVKEEGEEEEEEDDDHLQKRVNRRFIDEDDDDHQRKRVNQRFIDEDDDDNEDEYDEEKRIISIKEQIEDPHQSEDSLIDLLQTLADMDITFKALKETDIGRHVNRLRKHPSNDVKQLVKLLVRKWKDLVDEWVKSNGPVDGDAPQPNVSKHQQNGHHTQVPDFGYSPNPHNGSSGSDKSEYKPKAVPAQAPPLRRDPPTKPLNTASSASAPPPNRQKQVAVDPERLASARKRLQENYQEAQNAKKQRTIQVMEINELPKGKAKNSFFGRNKGGFQRH
ncbi:hypothetical protein RND81_06G017600 [Saponaria officinalis]|uniref:TFIIS N-terminal domain-containing protein n=1 Tax=Saponaria officinalis TaxID=3572 RepID=A0AAW1K6R0_SAPOF